MSTKTLDDIQARITETKKRLAALKSGTLESVGDRARERAVLNEELALLTEAETAEREHLKQQAAEKQAQDRKTALSNFESGITACLAEESRLVEAATKAMQSVIAAVTTIDEVWRQDAFNIPTKVLSKPERDAIKAAIDNESDRVSLSLFGALTKLAKDCPQSVKLKLGNLLGVPADADILKKPTILQTLKKISDPRYNVAEMKPQPKKGEQPQEAPKVGLYQSVSLRPPERSVPKAGEFVGGYYDGGNDAA